MTIDWKKEVELRKEDLLKDLFTLLRIDSVRDDSKATEDAPVGPGPKEALEAFLAIGERDGFTTKQVGNLAGHIEFAPNPDYKETLGVLGHVDVVPVGTGWVQIHSSHKLLMIVFMRVVQAMIKDQVWQHTTH